MKNVLFISTMDYDLAEDKATWEKKFQELARGMNVFILARGKPWKGEKYGVKFFLTPKWGTYIWMKISLYRGWYLIYKYKIDVIVCQSPLFDGWVAAWLKIFTRRELIVEVHSDWINSLFYQHKIPLKSLVRHLFIFMGKFSVAQADKVRVISTATEKLVKENSKHQEMYKFPTFTDIDMFKAETDIRYDKVIMYAGWLYYLKGIEYLIEAFSQLQDKYLDFKLLIVGDGPYRSKLEETAKKFNVKNIEFTGWLPLEKVKEYMRYCYLFALPSFSEGLGRVLIEAHMLRKPCIGARVDGIPDIIQEGKSGYLFTPGKAEEIKDSLEKLMSDPELARQMGEVGRHFVEDKFSTKQYFADYIRMIND